MNPGATLPTDHFLSKAVEKALFVFSKDLTYSWDQSYVDIKLDDPFARYDSKDDSSTQLPAGQETDGKPGKFRAGTEKSSTTTSIQTITNTLEVGTATVQSAPTVRQGPPLPAHESFGAVLSQVFLILSILSNENDFLTVPAISNLHRFPSIGHGAGFIARKIPRMAMAGLRNSLHPREEFFVYKSLRHYNRQAGDEGESDEGAKKRLKTILLELQVLTHPALRSHENIARLIGFGWETNRINPRSHVFQWPFVVMEYAPYGSMVDAFERYGMEYDTRQSLCIDVGQGILALHQCEIIHGDVKMENILVFPHDERGFIVKLADFGSTLVDLEGKAPSRRLAGYSAPWNAPEYYKTMTQGELYLTDVYSYGLLIWRTMGYGHAPFTENEGLLPHNEFQKMTRLKDEDELLGVALRSLEHLESCEGLFVKVKAALESSLQLDPGRRSLVSCVQALGGRISTSPQKPLRQVVIPHEQGLGIYEYSHHNLRLQCQLRHALESYCLSASTLDWSVSRMLVDNGSATLYAEYLTRYVSGDQWDRYHKDTTTRSLALSWLFVSAGTGQTSSAESVFPVFSAFSSLDYIPDSEPLTAGTALGLAGGSEFILKDVLQRSVPRKEEFLETFRTRFCRGAGITLDIPKEAFDGSGLKHFSQYLGEPLVGPKSSVKAVITPYHLLQTAAAWGCLDTVKSIISSYDVDINAQDTYGETALFKACRAGHSEVVQWLVTVGKARSDISTKKGITPLHWLDSFGTESVWDIARLLKSTGADPNAIARNNDEDTVEWQYYFFKGPPLMRVVASGNMKAVQALLDIGADPTLSEGAGESPIVFATRRLRADVLCLLLKKVPNYPVWHSTPGESSLVKYVLKCSPAYGVKIHGEDYFKALEETFDFLWDTLESPAGLFRAINPLGFIPIQVAVQEGSMSLTKKIVESCPEKGHLKELTVTIGMQAAILCGRVAIFVYLLDQGAQPLHPFLQPDPDEIDQFQLYVLDGPWTMDLARHQRKTTALHICPRAGDSAAALGRRMLQAILPASRWDRTPEHLRKEEHIDCCGVNGPVDDPLIDCRDEYDRTPLFCALEAEEYELAFQLFQAGANRNALVAHPAVHGGSPMRVKPDTDGLPIVEHALTWISAFRAIHFLIHECWGCLRLTNTYGDELRTGVIEETARWPQEEAAIVFNYVALRGYQNFKWNKELILAIECLNEAAVANILRRKDWIPQHTTPQALYDAARRTLVKGFRPPGNPTPAAILEYREKSFATGTRVLKILSLIRENYPNHEVGGSYVSGYPQAIIPAVLPELILSKKRYISNLIGPEKLINEVDKVLAPWLMVMGARASPAELADVEESLRRVMGDDVAVIWHLDKDGGGLCRERTKPFTPNLQGTAPSHWEEDLSPPGHHLLPVSWRKSGASPSPSSSADININQAVLPAGHQGQETHSVRRWMRDKFQGRFQLRQ